MTTPTSVGSNVQRAVPFFWVHDLEASVAFYADGLRFTVTRQWSHEGRRRWCWLELGQAAIMLQEFWRDGQHRNVPATTVGVGVTIAFICADALAVYRDLRTRNVKAARPSAGNGMWVVQVVDPDGYNLLFESPTDAPEGTEYLDR